MAQTNDLKLAPDLKLAGPAACDAGAKPALRRNLLLLATTILLLAGSGAEARRWRHYGYDVRDFDQNVPNRNSEWRAPGAGALLGPAGGFGPTVEAVIRGCSQESAELKNWPFDSLLQIVGPDDSQRNALEQMQSGAVEAADTLASACPKNVPAALPARLDSVAQVTEAFMAALDGVRPATEAFYSSLNDEQKARLVALYMSNNDAQRPPAPSQRSSRNDRRFPDVSTTQQKSICEQWAGALRDWPIRQIETSIPLSDIQHAALYDLTASVHRGAAALTTSCPTEMSFTPLGQIDAKRRRIDALRQAVNIIRPVLERFASSLNDDQKTRLNETVNSIRPAPPRRRQNDDD